MYSVVKSMYPTCNRKMMVSARTNMTTYHHGTLHAFVDAYKFMRFLKRYKVNGEVTIIYLQSVNDKALCKLTLSSLYGRMGKTHTDTDSAKEGVENDDNEQNDN